MSTGHKGFVNRNEVDSVGTLTAIIMTVDAIISVTKEQPVGH